jgi:hypothetical protein
LPPGVLGTFSYQTTGSEGTTIPGTTRSYPSTTKITNTVHGCGVLSTWKPIPEHSQSQLLCPDGSSIKIKAYATTISFYGVTSGENFACSGASYIYQPGVKAGHVWRYSCKSSDAVAKQVATVIGYEKLTVGGTAVRTLHVKVATTVSGAESGTSTQEYWIDTTKPVLVKEFGKVSAKQQNVTYQSSYSLTLDSLTPKA